MRFWLRHRLLLLSLSALFVTLLLCSLAIFWQVQSDLRNDGRQRVRFGVEQLDQQIRYVETFVSQELQDAPTDCSKNSLRELQLRMAGFPYVRNILFARDGMIYCSVQHGAVSVPVGKSQPAMLSFPESGYFPPHTPIGLYTLSKQHQQVMGVFGVWHIAHILTTLDGHSALYFSSGELWMDAAGNRLATNPLSAMSGTQIELVSAEYGFRIATVVPWFPAWSVVWQYSKGFIIALIAIGVVAYRLIYRYLSRYNSALAEMRNGLARGEFVPYLQPLNDSRTGKIKGCEILMRWQHPVRGVISPMQFIPQAEESGLIIPMTEALVKTVVDRFATLKHRLPEGFHFSINVTAPHLLAPTLDDACRYFLSRFEGCPVTLVLELTERDKRLMEDEVARRVQELKALGTLIAIDDFGTGYSGMSALQTLPVDLLKIDRCFVSKVLVDETSEYIIRNMISCSNDLHMKTIAEGVETPEQHQRLQQLGVDYLQGYLFSKPIDLDSFIATKL
ncbi:EAL domain-containing protein [Enterobacter sp.]|uniref:EAL domain-containing protein n=1 Tax=Enterobacter sp. TaxID=42895 RepID=UPI00296FAE59|nr:EAL domain-containing protein [Enterobacter sp.]